MTVLFGSAVRERRLSYCYYITHPQSFRLHTQFSHINYVIIPKDIHRQTEKCNAKPIARATHTCTNISTVKGEIGVLLAEPVERDCRIMGSYPGCRFGLPEPESLRIKCKNRCNRKLNRNISEGAGMFSPLLIDLDTRGPRNLFPLYRERALSRSAECKVR